ncbi:MAG: hypothetical protein V4665_02305, partial [Patescibacteria group bacterium]
MKYYKGYRIGSLEKSALKLFLGVTSVEFPSDRNAYGEDTWSLIFRTARQKTEMPHVVERLKEKGLIRLVSTHSRLGISLTKKGNEYLKVHFPDN